MGTPLMTRILIVEDEFITAKDISASLIDAGYDVVGTASSGEEAVEKAAQLRPHLVLMDIRLNGQMDGVVAAQRIQAAAEIPVVFLTAYSDIETMKRVLYAKPYGYVVKPYTEEELCDAIEKALFRDETRRRVNMW
jgi:DNA-binding NarL/FixJ family response regulator